MNSNFTDLMRNQFKTYPLVTVQKTFRKAAPKPVIYETLYAKSCIIAAGIQGFRTKKCNFSRIVSSHSCCEFVSSAFSN